MQQSNRVYLQDKHELFNKLFISPSYFNKLQPPLLVSPDFISILIQESSKAAPNHQRELIDEILNVFKQRPTNSIMLNEADNQINRTIVEKSILNTIVMRMLELVDWHDEGTVWVSKLTLVLAYYRIELKNIQTLTQWLGRQSHLEKFNPYKLRFILKVLKEYYTKKLGSKDSPSHYFYLLSESAGLKALIPKSQHSKSLNAFASLNLNLQQKFNAHKDELNFRSELMMLLVFNSQGPQTSFQKTCNLAYLECMQLGEIGLSYHTGRLSLQIAYTDDKDAKSGHQRQKIMITENLLEQVWYRVLINFTAQKTQIHINDKLFEIKSFLRKDTKKRLNQAVFGSGFFGMISSIVVSNKVWAFQRLDMQHFPYGISNWETLASLNKAIGSSSAMLSILPFSILEVKHTKYCFDVFQKNHCQLGENIIVVANIRENNIMNIGGIKLLLPLFYLARFYNKTVYPDLLSDLLEIVNVIMDCFDSVQLIEDLQASNFIQMMGQHLSELSELQTPKSIQFIELIYSKISTNTLRTRYIRHVIWNLNTGLTVNPQLPALDSFSLSAEDECNQQQTLAQQIKLLKNSFIEDLKSKQPTSQLQLTISAYYDLILRLYEKSKSESAYSFTQIVYWILQNLQSSVQALKFNCCMQHYVNDCILSKDFSLRTALKLHSKNRHCHYIYLERILSTLLEHKIDLGTLKESIECFKTLIRLFFRKYSACLYLTILRIMRKQLCRVSSKQAQQIFCSPQLDLLNFLAFLAERTINPEIITQIIYFAIYLQLSYSSSLKKQQAINFVSHVLRVSRNIGNDCSYSNPLHEAMKRQRKSSVDILEAKIHKATHEPLSHKLLTHQTTHELINDKLLAHQAHLSHRLLIQSRKCRSMHKAAKKHRDTPLTNQSINKKLLLHEIRKCSKPDKLSNRQNLYNLIINQLSLNHSQQQPQISAQITNEIGIRILLPYFQIACPLFQQNILLHCLSCLCMDSSMRQLDTIHTFILRALGLALSKLGQDKHYSRIIKHIVTIYTEVFSQAITQQLSISKLYARLSFHSPHNQIAYLLPKVMIKVLPSMNINQIIDAFMIVKFEVEKMGTQQESVLRNQYMQSMLTLIRKLNSETCQAVIYIINPFEVSSTNYSGTFLRIKQCKQIQLMSQVSSLAPFNYKIGNELGQQIFSIDVILSKLSRQVANKNIIGGESCESYAEEVPLETNQIDQSIMFVEEESSKERSTRRQAQYSDYFGKEVTFMEVYIDCVFSLLEIHHLNLNEHAKGSGQQSHTFLWLQKMSPQALIEEMLDIIKSYFFVTIRQKTVSDKKLDLRYIAYYLTAKCERPNLAKWVSESLFSRFWAFIIGQFVLPYIGLPQLDQSSYNSVIAYLAQKGEIYPVFVEDLQIFVDFCKYEKLLHIKSEWEQNKSQTQLYELLNRQGKFKMAFTFDSRIYSGFYNLQQENIHIVNHFFNKLIHENSNSKKTHPQRQKSTLSHNPFFEQTQRLFEKESVLQQQARANFLRERQCNFRKSQNDWQKLWEKYRIYHHPYSFWMAQKNSTDKFEYEEDSLRNFRFKVSQYCSDSNLTPVLEARIIEPWHILNDNQRQAKKYIKSFSEMMKPSHLEAPRKHKSQKNSNFLTDIWKNMWRLPSKSESEQFEVLWIARATKALGRLYIQQQEFLVFCFEGTRQDDSHVSFEKFRLSFNRETYKKWWLWEIKKIRLHRYLLRYHALRFQMNDSREIIFNFANEADKNKFLKQLQKIQRKKLQLFQQARRYKTNRVPFFCANVFDTLQNYGSLQREVTQRWRKREISNFQYLIHVNKWASRGRYDLSQYYVIPWIVEMNDHKDPRLRDLSKTMGALGSQERRLIYLEKYNTHDPFNPYPPFYFGTHYSSPGVIFNFLIRLSPFTEYCKHLQGGRFDIADRLFSSLMSSWKSASEQVSDVRQLTPEFYYLPEMLINVDKYNFGRTQNHVMINHVDIPSSWGTSNPYYFVSQLKIMIEGDHVSDTLSDWIDLIFGYKQKGKEAVDNLNVYYYLTYEEAVQQLEEQDNDEVFLKSKQAQIVHFGQIPPQLFDRPHPKRQPANRESIEQLAFIKRISFTNTLKDIIGLQLFDNQELVMLKRNEIESLSVRGDPAILKTYKRLNIDKSISGRYYLLKKNRCRVIFFRKTFMVVWGYMNHEFRVYNRNTGDVIDFEQLASPILSLHLDKFQNLLCVGTDFGVLEIYELQYLSGDKLQLHRTGIETFPGPVTNISEYDGFYAICFANYCSIYKIFRTFEYLSQPDSHEGSPTKFFRSFQNNLPIKASFIMKSPLYSLVIIDNASIKVYSINGQLIRSISSYAKHYLRMQDRDLNDILCACEEDRIIALSIPDLRSTSVLELPQECTLIGQTGYVRCKNEIKAFGFQSVQDTI